MNENNQTSNKAKAKTPSAFVPISFRSIRGKMIAKQKDQGLMRPLPNGDMGTKYQATTSSVYVIQEYANGELQKLERMIDRMVGTTIEIGETVNAGIGNQSHKIHRLLGIWAERARSTEIERARKETA